MKDAANATPSPHQPARPEANGAAVRTRTALAIIGMRGNGCREAVFEALEATAGVEDVDVNLHRARAMVVHRRSCLSIDLVRAVVGAGYDAAVLLSSRGTDGIMIRESNARNGRADA